MMPLNNSRLPDDRRPVPEDLLTLANAEERSNREGKLIVYLGYAAGVGKTYTMLWDALQLRAEGKEVVIGYVETHKRVETEALAARLEAIPPARIWYQGLDIREMDLDAVIARKPAIVLVDELAHTNAPNSRHLKRYQDIEELLRAGISVFTTVNIQHVDSLNDAISQITGVQVSETVPDTFFDLADDIRLIDLTPEELQARMKAGKVYLGEMASQAIEHFFSTGNLVALRQLTLRYLAQRTDRQMVTHMRARAIPGPWPAVERILVAIRPNPSAEAMVRAAYRDSLRMNAEWVVISVEEERRGPPSEQEQAWLRSAMETARKLGGTIVLYRGEDVANEILRYARQHNVTTIMLGKPRGLDIMVSPVYRIMRRSTGIDIILFDAKGAPAIPLERQIPGLIPRDYLITLVLILAATLLNYLLFGTISTTNLIIIQLLPVVVSAWFFSRGASLFAAVVSILVFDIAFVAPYYTLSISDWEYFISFTGYVIIALMISHLANRLRYLLPQIRESEATVAAVAGLSKDLVETSDYEEILTILADHMHSFAPGKVSILVPDDGGLKVAKGDEDYPFTDKELTIARWVYDNGEVAGSGTDTLPGGTGHYVPIKAHGLVYGVMAFAFQNPDAVLTLESKGVPEAMAQLGALALERLRK
jgi:two-component system sensor histidine kinase KdpD